ncbi:RNA polymerase sigma factor [Lachnoclostridium sp. Marseille-P6806]|uniref:RNA polymerase sigma factor n=1 Tax=Lachnoclostridium sp. Marseille-P6806 TaxID=2364793 RepID=UPI0010314E5E|nr:RNA polymerase sigma factor [Lachnoclostridium sp. Marseille-P6806]
MIDRYQSLIFSLCYRMTSDYFAAQDLAQETFLSAFRSMDRFRGDNEKAWLCRIAANKCVDYLRSQERLVPTEAEQMDRREGGLETPSVYAEERELREQLRENCLRLKEPYAEIAFYYFCEERSPAEIAALCGRKLKTTQTQISRAREMLREVYRNFRKEAQGV